MVSLVFSRVMLYEGRGPVGKRKVNGDFLKGTLFLAKNYAVQAHPFENIAPENVERKLLRWKLTTMVVLKGTRS